ncbi:MAG: nucleotidyltransferase family protein [Armatimonadetes bacterium]|nr:nucleotidyltransferase family protein [Armatimonadota bacterium]
MTVDEVRTILAGHKAELAAMGVLSLRLFGSVARGEAGPASDVDFLAELHEDLDLLDVVGVKLFLEDTLGTRVDVVEPQALKPRMRERVLLEAVDAA